MDDSVETEATGDKIMTPDPDMSSRIAGHEIELEEFQSRP